MTHVRLPFVGGSHDGTLRVVPWPPPAELSYACPLHGMRPTSPHVTSVPDRSPDLEDLGRVVAEVERYVLVTEVPWDGRLPGGRAYVLANPGEQRVLEIMAAGAGFRRAERFDFIDPHADTLSFDEWDDLMDVVWG